MNSMKSGIATAAAIAALATGNAARAQEAAHDLVLHGNLDAKISAEGERSGRLDLLAKLPAYRLVGFHEMNANYAAGDVTTQSKTSATYALGSGMLRGLHVGATAMETNGEVTLAPEIAYLRPHLVARIWGDGESLTGLLQATAELGPAEFRARLVAKNRVGAVAAELQAMVPLGERLGLGAQYDRNLLKDEGRLSLVGQYRF